MKKLLSSLFLFSIIWSAVSAQSPVTEYNDYTISPAVVNNADEDATGVVIIDDDELGVSVAPNPTTDYVAILSAKDMSNNLFSVIDNLGLPILTQQLTSTIIDVSSLNSGCYFWVITNEQNQSLQKGILVVQ